MFLKHHSKPYDADFVFVEIDKMLLSCYSFIETTKPREKTPKSIMTSYEFSGTLRTGSHFFSNEDAWKL